MNNAADRGLESKKQLRHHLAQLHENEASVKKACPSTLKLDHSGPVNSLTSAIDNGLPRVPRFRLMLPLKTHLEAFKGHRVLGREASAHTFAYYVIIQLGIID